jgi:uncharacterized protein YgiM (DUF1202 family)
MRSVWLLLFCIIASFVISACSSGSQTTEEPTRSSEDVLRTAEAIAEETRQAATPTFSPTPITPSPTVIEDTATPQSTATPAEPIVRANYNANVRSGPDEAYQVIDFFLDGEEANVIGQYAHPTMGVWWYVKRIGQGLNGWVWGGAVTVSGDTSAVPYLEAPPTSTSTPKPTSTPADTDTPTVEPTATT